MRYNVYRIVWVILVVLASWSMILVVTSSYNSYKNHPVSFVADTAYLRWNTDFPTITVCEKESTDKIYDIAEMLYGEDRNMNLDLFFKDIAFFKGRCISCETNCKKDIDCSQDFSKIVTEFRSNCSSLLTSCKWNKVELNCCEHFLPIPTELGPCFTFNSALDKNLIRNNGTRSHDQKFHNALRKFYSNRKTGPGTLYFEARESINLYLHSPYDVPYTNHPQREKAIVEWGNGLMLEFQVKEVDNMEGVKDLSVWQRRCRFPWELRSNTLSLYKQYSYSTCIVDCHAAAQLRMCNCTDHFLPTPLDWNSTCNVDGLACLTKHQSILRSLRTEWATKPGLVCDCETGCLEPEYTIVRRKLTRYQQQNGKVEVYLTSEYGNTVPMEPFTQKHKCRFIYMISLICSLPLYAMI